MQTKTFSVKDGTLKVINNIVVLWEKVTDEIPIATTPSDVVTNNVHTLPSTIIRNQTDEELADDWSKDYHYASSKQDVAKESFFAGRKSVGGEFHLNREELEKVIDMARDNHFIGFANQYSHNLETIIDAITSTIYPHTITVEHDGEKYYWETLKAEY